MNLNSIIFHLISIDVMLSNLRWVNISLRIAGRFQLLDEHGVTVNSFSLLKELLFSNFHFRSA